MPRRVLVVGAGVSGLVAIKECREAGLEVVCLEALPWIGGLWRFTDNESHSSVYRSTVINTSKEMMSMSDFLVPQEFPTYMHHTQCLEYFGMYADHFNLRSSIRLNTRVRLIKPAPDYASTGRYTAWYTTKDEPEVEETFDAVMVCTGHHWQPRTPAFAGLDRFRGTTMHAHSYKDHRGFENKHIVVVGVGNSGLDVAVELSRFAKQVYLVTRSGTWLLERVGPGGLPVDYYISTRVTNALPLSVRNFFGEMQINAAVGDLDLYGLTPKHHIMSAHPSVNGELIGRINTGAIVVRPNIKEFGETSVVYEDGQEFPCDAVVFATGYTYGFPFLDPACGFTVVNNEVPLYKFVFPPRNKHATLCAIGLIQPLGGIMPLSELQCRWAARVFSGKSTLPSEAAMLSDVQRTREEMRKRYVPSLRHTVQVDYIDYADELAAIIGCKPSFWPIFLRDPKLAVAMWTTGVVPSQYRVVGPGAWPGARDAILGAKDRIVFANSGGKHLSDLAPKGNTTRTLVRILLLVLAVYAIRTAMRRRQSVL